MDYCDVVSQLINILLMVFNKTDTLILTEEMAQKYLQVDELLQQLIVRELAADVGKVAQKLMIRQLAKVNTAMKNSGYQVTKEKWRKMKKDFVFWLIMDWISFNN